MTIPHLTNYVAFAIPFFFLLIGIELIVDKIKNGHHYRFSDSITNLSCGIGNQVVNATIKLLALGAYYWLQSHYSLFKIPVDSPIYWLLCLICVDFAYYWYHRLSHEINFMWAMHIVHHQSEEYNLTVALRQAMFARLIAFAFYLPIAFIGFPIEMFFVVAQFQLIYQFWIHTPYVPKLGFLEYIFMTPSQHRVHHGKNSIYLDKNHGGTFSIWDRLFGTYREETVKVYFGTTKPLKSWNPIWSNFVYWREMIDVAKTKSTFSEKIKVFLKGPKDMPIPAEGLPEVTYKYDTPKMKWMNRYVFVHFVLAVLCLGLYLKQAKVEFDFSFYYLGAIILVSILNFGAMFELKRWVRWSELLRMVMIVGFLYITFQNGFINHIGWLVIGAILSLISWTVMNRLLDRYQTGLTPISS
ncbi:MAG: sterol desaturase [Bdellovibrionaceae bacterium]|nr:sterol desaturase [Pseudobdellovibrionaceae bacterium]|tara:strand:+ start:1802 stop:3037 length:1236 start_codon:yes stop_codon:yes gene_type:complete